MKGGLTGLEVLRRVCSALVESRVFAAQVAVLAWVAEHPGASSYGTSVGVGVSQQHAYRMMKELVDIGDLWEVKRRKGRAINAHYVSPQGIKTLELMVKRMGFDVKGLYKVVQENDKENFVI